MHACAGDDCVSVSSGALDVNISRIRCGPGHGLRLINYINPLSAKKNKGIKEGETNIYK